MENERLTHEFLRYMVLLARAPEQEKAFKLARGEMFAMSCIFRHGSVNPHDISREMHTSTARTASLLRTLSEKELIDRKPDERDKRAVLISLTTEGEEFLLNQTGHSVGNACKMLEDLGEKDANELVRIMGRIAENALGLRKEEVDKCLN